MFSLGIVAASIGFMMPGTPAPQSAPPGPKNGEEVAVMETVQGTIILRFFPSVAPKHVANFKRLVRSGFYNGTKFHRVIPGFMIQGGDPNTKTGKGPAGTGGPGWTVNAEFNKIHHARGILSMARSQDPNSAGSQFFIMHGDAPFLDNQYTVFGTVVKGLEVVDKIVNVKTNGDQVQDMSKTAIKRVRLVRWPVR